MSIIQGKCDSPTSQVGRPISVLNLVTSPNASFYRKQVRSVEQYDVDCKTLPVPGISDGTKADVNRTPLDYMRFFSAVRRELRRGDYDVIHANYGLTAPHALAQFEIPTVLSLWGSDVLGPLGWLSKVTAPQFDAVVVMSDQLASELPTDCTVIPHGIDIQQFSPMQQDRAREELGWSKEAHQVLFPAPIAREEKNFPRAKRVVRAARSQVSGPVVLQTPNGEVPHDRMPVLMNAADALTLTSRHEGSPNVIKEALACNLPVVSTDVGDISSRIAGVSPSAVGQTDDQLVAALVSILEAGERSNGRQAVADIDLDSTARRLRAVYDGVLDVEP